MRSLSTNSSERCYIAEPPPVDAIGGFHSPYSLGYQYWYRAAFVVTLSRETLPTKELRTIELVRNFLHDCLHHSTFVSFRRVMRLLAKSPEEAKHRAPQVYREQYGINFRNQDGLSYSSPELTLRSPETINLNLLMDGVVVRISATLLRETEAYATSVANEIEEELKKEIFLEPFSASVLSRASDFETAVTKPSQMFIEHWGGEEFLALVLQAMMNGNLRKLQRHFEDRSDVPNAWEKMFKRPEFHFS